LSILQISLNGSVMIIANFGRMRNVGSNKSQEIEMLPYH